LTSNGTEPISETLTAMGGVPLLARAFRFLKMPARVREQVRVKQLEWGLCAASRSATVADSVASAATTGPLRFSAGVPQTGLGPWGDSTHGPDNSAPPCPPWPS